MFKKARFTLTAWYLLIIMAISITFSVIIYTMLMGEVERFERMQRFRMERRVQEEMVIPPDIRLRIVPAPLLVNEELINETKHHIIVMLVGVNAAIFVISGALGYFLAGRTLKPIKEMMDEQNRFISDASHEFRTPLTSLKTAFEVFLRNTKPTLKEAKTVIGESVREVNKLQSLSDALLELAQYQQLNGKRDFETVSLQTIIGDAVQKVTPLAKQKHIVVKSTMETIEIEGSKFGLVDLFVILLDNAIKYSIPKGDVLISSQKTDSHVSVMIDDQGIGIEEKDMPFIFDRFFRADSARTKTNEGGYGLGLSIAKKIIEEHHGSIDVKSIVAKGTTFTITLPVHQSSLRTKPRFFSSF